MTKKVLLFFLVISVGYAEDFLAEATFHPKAAIMAEAQDSVGSGDDGEDTDFC